MMLRLASTLVTLRRWPRYAGFAAITVIVASTVLSVGPSRLMSQAGQNLTYIADRVEHAGAAAIATVRTERGRDVASNRASDRHDGAKSKTDESTTRKSESVASTATSAIAGRDLHSDNRGLRCGQLSCLYKNDDVKGDQQISSAGQGNGLGTGTGQGNPGLGTGTGQGNPGLGTGTGTGNTGLGTSTGQGNPGLGTSQGIPTLGGPSQGGPTQDDPIGAGGGSATPELPTSILFALGLIPTLFGIAYLGRRRRAFSGR
jgi:hypothetical protein